MGDQALFSGQRRAAAPRPRSSYAARDAVAGEDPGGEVQVAVRKGRGVGGWGESSNGASRLGEVLAGREGGGTSVSRDAVESNQACGQRGEGHGGKGTGWAGGRGQGKAGVSTTDGSGKGGEGRGNGGGKHMPDGPSTPSPSFEPDALRAPIDRVLSRRKCFFAKVNSRTNPSMYPLLLLL